MGFPTHGSLREARKSWWLHALTALARVAPRRAARDFLIDYASRVYVNRAFGYA